MGEKKKNGEADDMAGDQRKDVRVGNGRMNRTSGLRIGVSGLRVEGGRVNLN